MKILYILLAILIFSAILFVHELGHFAFARMFRVTVKEFALGMGPAILKHTSKKTGTVYAVRLFPFGGYVSMVGEDEDSEDINALSHKPSWQRFLIIAAGAAMNLLTGIILTVVLVSQMTIGTATVAEFADVGDVGSLNSGMMAGDTIVAVNGKSVHIPHEAYYYILHDGYQPIDVTVKRGDDYLTFRVTFATQVMEDGTLYGVPDTVFYAENGGFFSRVRYSFYYAGLSVRMIWEGFGDIITGRVAASSVSGPVGITSEITSAAESGDYMNLIYIAMIISLNVGIFNLLPFPALDGGRLVFTAWEMVTKKPVPAKIEAVIHGIGIMILIFLSVIILFKDVIGLFG